MTSYFIYLIIAGSTIASPGPGVVMTLTNSLTYGLVQMFAGFIKNRAANYNYFTFVNSFGGAAYITFGLSLLALTRKSDG